MLLGLKELKYHPKPEGNQRKADSGTFGPCGRLVDK